MRIASNFEEIVAWCMAANEGDHEEFNLSGDPISQQQASAYAAEVNAKRNGHVWINVGDLACVPDPVTRISVRVTN